MPPPVQPNEAPRPQPHSVDLPAPRRERAPVLARAYVGTSGAWRKAGALLQAAYEGTWLGVLGREDLHGIDEGFYDDNAVYNGDAHNLRGLFPWEEEALAFGFGECRRLMVLGAGGGREVLALAARGYQVVGYECNRALVQYAAGFLERQGCGARVHLLPRDAVPPADAPFDGLILGWTAYTLIPGRAHRVSLLRRLRPLVRPGGPLLLSFWPRLQDGLRQHATLRVANAWRALLRRERAEPGDRLAPNFIHGFTRDEVEGELREAGWEMRRFRPGTGGHDSGWAVAVAQPG